MNKIILLIITLIFLIPSIIPNIVGNQVLTNNIIYVDDDGGADYTKIQDAIDNSSDGYTIYVYNGIYFENIIIDKSINLTGENRFSTIIKSENPNENVVYVLSNRVSINEFTIRNGNYGILINNSSNNKITGNIISKNINNGIALFYSLNNSIIRNIIFNNKGNGISQYSSSNNTITDNNISENNQYGMSILFPCSMEIWLLMAKSLMNRIIATLANTEPFGL